MKNQVYNYFSSIFVENPQIMLIYFKVANYKSIKEEVTLNFNAASISEHTNTNCINRPRFSLIKSIVLYGHNASGKSKILDALVFFKRYIINSATEKASNAQIDVEPFEFNEKSCDLPSFFEMAFVIGALKYRYGFEADKDSIQKEWLLESKATKEYPVFLRMNQSVEVDYKRFPDSEGLEKRTRKNALFLSVASQWNVFKAQQINEWIDSIFTVHRMEDLEYRDLTIDLLNDGKYEALVNNFIKRADLGINSIDVVDIPVKIGNVSEGLPNELKEFFKKRNNGPTGKAVFAIHNKYNDNNEVIGKVPLLLDKFESEGTIKYFNIVGVIIKALMENRVVIIDEFDARLHTLLSKAIVKLFNSSILKSSAQIIVASHDTALLDKNILRRDQIYFVEKNEIGATSVVSLVEYKPRKDTPYDRNYLDGKYGAIPFIEDLEKLFVNGKR